MTGDPADSALAAGGFSEWIGAAEEALRGGTDAEVPCDGCTACCTAGQFVHIGPDELDTLAHIPPGLLFPAPQRPPGHVVMGYDERGHCPMLRDGRCGIYEHRPRTCRAYDCRVFAASGLVPEGAARVEIRRRISRWRFDYPDDVDRLEHDAVKRAADYLVAHGPDLGPAVAGNDVAAVSLLAMWIRALFAGADPEIGSVRAAIGAATGSG